LEKLLFPEDGYHVPGRDLMLAALWLPGACRIESKESEQEGEERC
jgi:hypothetical protein